MILDLLKKEDRESLEKVLWKYIENCSEVVSIDQLTGGASRQMFIAKVKSGLEEVNIVLRLSGHEGEETIDQLSLAQEVLVSKAVANAGVKTPHVYFEFHEDDGIGEGYGMEFLLGETLGGRIARSRKFENARKDLVTQLGRSLAKIHQVDVSDSSLESILPTHTGDYLVDTMYRVYRNSNIYVPMIEYSYRWLKDNLPAYVTPVVTHGDFRNGNLLVHVEKGLVGVLDWELAALCDPMRDLAYCCLPPWRYGVGHLEVGGFGTMEAFFKAYEAELGQSIDAERFKFWYIYACFWWSIACIEMGISYRKQEGKLGDRIAIGRRHTEGLIDILNILCPGPVTLETPAEASAGTEVATVEELLVSCQRDLKSIISPELEGKSLFISRVAMNNLGVALRELQHGRERDRQEIDSTNLLLRSKYSDLATCRKELCLALRKEDWKFQKVDLEQHLRSTVVAQLAIDQPTYSSLKEALAYVQEL